MLDPRELQLGRSRDAIDPGHVARYQWAALCGAQWFGSVAGDVLDLFCGVGYGTELLAEVFSGAKIAGIDRHKEAIEIAREHYDHPRITFCPATFRVDGGPRLGDAIHLEQAWKLIVCLEGIEHVLHDTMLLEMIHHMLLPYGALILSAPEEHTQPFRPDLFPYHYRHYTEPELEKLLISTGFKVQVRGRQDLEDLTRIETQVLREDAWRTKKTKSLLFLATKSEPGIER